MNLKEISSKLLEELSSSVEAEIQGYKFYYGCFKLSRENYGISPPVAPIMADIIAANRKFPSFSEFLQSILSRCSVSGHMKFLKNGCWPGGKKSVRPDAEAMTAKARQLWTGFLREYDTIIRIVRLDPAGMILQDVEADIGQGMVDYYYRRSDNKVYALAIGHEGKYSSEYFHRRKQDKAQPQVVRLIAANQGGYTLHRVSDEAIQELVGKETCLV